MKKKINEMYQIYMRAVIIIKAIQFIKTAHTFVSIGNKMLSSTNFVRIRTYISRGREIMLR